MKKNEIQKKISGLVYDKLELVSRLDLEINPETKLDKILTDSIDALSLKLELELEFQIKINDDVKIEDLETFDRLTDFIAVLILEQKSRLVGPDE